MNTRNGIIKAGIISMVLPLRNTAQTVQPKQRVLPQLLDVFMCEK